MEETARRVRLRRLLWLERRDGIVRSRDQAMQSTDVKEDARRLVEDLPAGATWEDLTYRIYVRQAIEAGLRDSDAGRTADVSEVRAKLGLPQTSPTGFRETAASYAEA